MYLVWSWGLEGVVTGPSGNREILILLRRRRTDYFDQGVSGGEHTAGFEESIALGAEDTSCGNIFVLCYAADLVNQPTLLVLCNSTSIIPSVSLLGTLSVMQPEVV
jgi:hypothetical protein